ncbi:MAG: S8 family peptidase [Saccharofermentanales bacterium]
MKKLLVISLIFVLSLSACLKSDDSSSIQWGFNNYGQKVNGLAGIAGIDVNYQDFYACPDDFPIIAIIDSGFNLSHPHFAGLIFLKGFDFIDNQEISNDELATHGTGILGVMVKPSSNRMKGLLKNPRVLPIRAFDGIAASVDNIIRAIKFAEGEGAKIVNCSFTLQYFNQDLLDTIKSSSMVFICAAGNDHLKRVQFPAAYDLPNIISVMGINHLGFVSKYSSYEEKIFISAPGESVYCPQVKSEYAYMDGSSIAVPFITAACAILYYKVKNNDLKEHILKCSSQVNTLAGFVNKGNIIDFEKVINYKINNEELFADRKGVLCTMLKSND